MGSINSIKTTFSFYDSFVFIRGTITFTNSELDPAHPFKFEIMSSDLNRRIPMGGGNQPLLSRDIAKHASATTVFSKTVTEFNNAPSPGYLQVLRTASPTGLEVHFCSTTSKSNMNHPCFRHSSMQEKLSLDNNQDIILEHDTQLFFGSILGLEFRVKWDMVQVVCFHNFMYFMYLLLKFITTIIIIFIITLIIIYIIMFIIMLWSS